MRKEPRELKLRSCMFVAPLCLAACGFLPKSNGTDAGSTDGGTCGGSGTIDFTGTDGVHYSDPGCWIFNIQGAGTPPLSGELDSPGATSTAGTSIFFAANDQVTNAPCAWASGTTQALTSQCLGLCVDWDDASGLAWSACGGYQAAAANPPAGSLTVVHWPSNAGDTLTVSFSSGAQLQVNQRNNDCSPACETQKLVPVSGSVTSPSK